MHVLLTSGEDILYLASNSEDEITFACVLALAPYVRAPSLHKNRLEQGHFYSLNVYTRGTLKKPSIHKVDLTNICNP